MTAEAFFGRDARITMEVKSGAATQEIHGEITAFNESGGEKNTESIPVMGGGKIIKEMLTTDTEVSFDVIPTDLKFFEPLYGAKTTETVEVVKSTESARADYRITLAWAEGFDSGSPPEPNSGEGTRYTFVGANGTKMVPTGDAENELKATITFKLSATDSSGNAQIYREYSPNSATTAFPDPYGDAGVRQAFDSYA